MIQSTTSRSATIERQDDDEPALRHDHPVRPASRSTSSASGSRSCADLGYTDVWSSEANGADAFTPLALASVWAPSLRLGTAIVPRLHPRPGARWPSASASLAEAAPGSVRARASARRSNVIVERWNGIPFEEPYKRTRDMVRFLRAALTGEKVTDDYDTFAVEGLQARRACPTEPVPILVAALREGMLRLAGREGDGAIINWLVGRRRVARSRRSCTPAGDGATRRSSPASSWRPSEDADTVRGMGRFAIAAYLNVPVYAAFHEWLGRGDAARPTCGGSGRRATARPPSPPSPTRSSTSSSSTARPRSAASTSQRYVDNGVTTPALAILPFPGIDQRQAIRDLAPR